MNLRLRLATILMILNHDLITEPFNIMSISARANSTMLSNGCYEESLRHGGQAISLVIRSWVGPGAME